MKKTLLTLLMLALIFSVNDFAFSAGTAEVSSSPGAAEINASSNTQESNVSSEINNATIKIKELSQPITNVSGKLKWLDTGTEIADVKFNILNSQFSANGFIAKRNAVHKFSVSSEAFNFEDAKKIFPVLSQFNIAGALKFRCNVDGTGDDPVLTANFSLPNAAFDFGKLIPELKGINISNIALDINYAKQAYEIKNLVFNTLGGNVKISGAYNPAATSEAALNFSLGALDASQIASFFPEAAGKLTGKFDANFAIKNILDAENAFAEGNISFYDGALKNFEFLSKLGSQLKMSLAELKYKSIGGFFKLYKNKKIDFQNFAVDSEIIKVKTSGAIDEAQNLKAKLFAEITGGNIGEKINDDRLGKLLKKVVKGIKANFLITGTTQQPKVELDMGQAF